MRQIHEQLKPLADIMIFDRPPYLAAAEAQVLTGTLMGAACTPAPQ